MINKIKRLRSKQEREPRQFPGCRPIDFCHPSTKSNAQAGPDVIQGVERRKRAVSRYVSVYQYVQGITPINRAPIIFQFRITTNPHPPPPSTCFNNRKRWINLSSSSSSSSSCVGRRSLYGKSPTLQSWIYIYEVDSSFFPSLSPPFSPYTSFSYHRSNPAKIRDRTRLSIHLTDGINSRNVLYVGM